MKGKFSLMWRVVIALVLVCSLGLVMATPSPVQALTGGDVTVTGFKAGEAATSYAIDFTTEVNLVAGDTITIEFPSDTDVSGIVVEDISGVTASAVTVQGQRVVITLGVDVAAGAQTITIGNHIINPTTPGDYTLKVYTSKEPTAVESNSYTIYPRSSNTPTSVAVTTPTSDVAGASTAYNIDIKLGSDGAISYGDTITIVFPEGTTVPGTIATSDVTVEGTAAASVDVSGLEVTVGVPTGVSVGNGETADVDFALAAGLKNPQDAANYTLTAATSVEPVAQTSGTYDIVAGTITQLGFSVQPSQVAPNTPSTVFTVQSQDQYGNLATSTATVLPTSTSATGRFYSDEGCTIEITTINLVAGQANFYYKDSTPGNYTITVAEIPSQGWDDATTALTVNPQVALYHGDTFVANFNTIQVAIDAAVPGDTIKVGAGTYSAATGESFPITVSKQLTIESTAGATNTTIDGGSAVNIVDVSAAEVTIDGFTIRGDGITTNQRGLYLRKSGFTLKNNIFTGIRSDNIFVESGAGAITSGLIDNNTIIGAGDDSLRNGILVESYNNNGISGVTISNNTISGISGTSAGEWAAITVAQTGSAEVTQITITGNTITNCTKGIRTIGNVTGLTGDYAIANNTISGCLEGVTAEGDGAVAGFDLVQNTITNNARYGICLYNNDGTFTIKYNDITGNGEWGLFHWSGVGIQVTASYNWWGHVSGPSGGSGEWASTYGSGALGQGDGVCKDVTYSPWLAASQASVVESGKSQYATSVTLSKVATLSGTTYSGGWNTFSTPIWLDGSADTWGEITALVNLQYVTAYGWDGTGWTIIGTDTTITPLDAIFVQLKTSAQSLPILYSTQLLPAPTKLMHAAAGSYTGWELVGVAKLTEDYQQQTVLASIANKYSQVIDPISGDVIAANGSMEVGKGYWVFMTSDGTLAGFTVTPVEWEAVP